MEVPFSPDVEAELQQVAASYGKTAAEFVRQAMSNALERRAQFLAAVDRGIASADRGELIEHEEAMQRLDALFRS